MCVKVVIYIQIYASIFLMSIHNKEYKLVYEMVLGCRISLIMQYWTLHFSLQQMNFLQFLVSILCEGNVMNLLLNGLFHK
jgi:hypothetical protein